MTTIADLQRALADFNVQAFLRVIRERESGQGEDAYTIVNGGAHFTDFAHHPFGELPTTQGGRAAGAYQFLPTTWAGLVKQYGFPDFGPPNQDLGAVALIVGRGALGDVLLGDFGHAIPKLRAEWTSLPGASESSSGWTMEKAAQVYIAYGGKFAAQDGGEVPQHPAPIDPGATPAPPQVSAPQPQPAGARMPILALISAFGPLLAQLIPQIAKAVNPQAGEKTQQVLTVAQTVFDAVTAATGAPNVQGAIEALQRDPALVQTVTKAVINDPTIMVLLEIGGGIQAARAADVVMAQQERPFWQISQAFWVTILCVMPPVDFMVYTVVSKMPEPSEQLATQIVTGLLSLIAVAAAYYFGTTQSSKSKDDAIVNLSAKT